MPDTPPKPQKRRIIPVQVVDAPPPSPVKKDKWARKAEKHLKRAGMEGGRSVTYEKHLKSVHDPDYHKSVVQRALDLGYERSGKKVSSKSSSKSTKARDVREHGSHHEHLSDWSNYIKEFARMKSHSKGVSIYEYLKKQFKNGLYYSPITRRFRKYR